MSQLLYLFWGPIIAASLAAATLALIGCQVAARDKSVESICLGQGAMTGVLVGIGLVGIGHEDSEIGYHFLPFIFAIVASVAVTWYGRALLRSQKASANTYLVALFGLLLGLNYLITAIFPGLESHMSQVFFGDLSTLSSFDAGVTLGFSAIVFALNIVSYRQLSNAAFEAVILGTPPKRKNSLAAVEIIAFLFVCFSIQFLGFLFTILCLFLPTALLSFDKRLGLSRHLTMASVLAMIAAAGGFVFSLAVPTLPTTPAIGLIIAVLGVVFVAVSTLLIRCSISQK